MAEVAKAVVGLGNPGRKYLRTRHNIGFLVADALAERVGSHFAVRTGLYTLARAEVEGVGFVVAKPLTFMNNSGQAVATLLRNLTLPPEAVLVVHDDVNLPFGRLRLRGKGSDGGHNGVASIIAELGTQRFPRLRIGIGSHFPPGKMVEYVLSKFGHEEWLQLEGVIGRAVDACLTFLTSSLAEAMNQFNRQPQSSARCGPEHTGRL
ncbi:MAG: aminoacyl-tRNA hydrolase [bacterium]|jgi:PTH1 family peptidyl-tRNA hydrolase|nr:aminoacyl-tRNA hydrolase [candidate division KSB1 bacterium]MDH7559636.1 aminoacyl-tRNA hydrolase [bacterium]